MQDKTQIVSLSGGVGSYCVLVRMLEQYPDVVPIFMDTLIEDEDLYRFLRDIERAHLINIIRLVDGRTPWEVFRDVKYIGNTQHDPCSYHLKRKLFRKYIKNNFGPDECVINIGIDWTESHRMEGVGKYWTPYMARAPLTEPPYMNRTEMFDLVKKNGIKPPRLYQYGFHHNNCGGMCVKAGQAQFRQLLKTFPERYQHHEEQEQQTREHIGKPQSILRDRTGGITKPITLAEFRNRLELQPQLFDSEDWGGCACFTPDNYYEEEEDK